MFPRGELLFYLKVRVYERHIIYVRRKPVVSPKRVIQCWFTGATQTQAIHTSDANASDSHLQRKRKHSEKPNMADEVEVLLVFFAVILGL